MQHWDAGKAIGTTEWRPTTPSDLLLGEKLGLLAPVPDVPLPDVEVSARMRVVAWGGASLVSLGLWVVIARAGMAILG